MELLLPAYGFVNPLMLGGLGLIALPILIHLLSRRHYRRLPWGAMRFLLEAERRTRRRVRFERWLLLALRCAAMALLALFLARPFVQPGFIASLLGGGAGLERMIVIDDSASLDYRAGETSDFQRLRAAGERLLTWLVDGAPGDRVTLIRTSDPDHPLADRERLTPTALPEMQRHLRELEVSHRSAEPQRALASVADRLSRDGAPHRAILYVLSDFQRSEWLATADAAGGAFSALHDLEPDALRVVMISPVTGLRENAALVDLQIERPHALAGVPAVFQATVANHTTQPLRDLNLQVDVAGSPLPPVRVERVNPGESQRVAFEAAFAEPGVQRVTASLARSDAFSADDAVRIAVPASDALAVLIVNGQPSTDPMRDEAYFPRNALAPPGPFASGMRVEVIDAADLEATDLSEFDCVLLCNVPPPAAPAAAALLRYVQAGGGVAVFLGEEVGDADEFNRALYADGAGILPAPLDSLRQARGPDDSVRLVRVGDHPVTAMFPDGSEALGETVRFRTFYRVNAEFRAPTSEPDQSRDRQRAVRMPERSARQGNAAATNRAGPPVVLARFTDAASSPALVERRIDRGRVMLLTSTIDLAWNDWARAVDGSYVVTMLELVHYLARRDPTPLAFRAGQRLRLQVSPTRFEPSGEFRSPRYPDEPATPVRLRETDLAGDVLMELEGPVAERLGTYQVVLRDRAGGERVRPLCVNLPERESDLTAATQGELAASLGEIPHETIRADEAFLKSDEHVRQELWKSLLTALIGILVLEQFLAWWFGRAQLTVARGRGRTGRLAPLLDRIVPRRRGVRA